MNIRKIIKEEVKKVMELMMRREDEIPLPGNEENRNNFRKNSPMYKKAKKLKTEREVEMVDADEVEVMEETEEIESIKEAKTTDTAMKPNKKTEDDKAIEKIRKERTDNEKKPRWPSDITDENLDRITKKLNIDWHKFSKAQFKKGIKVEHEHDDITHGDLLLTAKIVWAHLKENPKYYDALENMEKKLDDKIQTKTKSEAPMKIKESVDVERWQKLAGLKK